MSIINKEIDKLNNKITLTTDFDFIEFSIKETKDYFMLDFVENKYLYTGCPLLYQDFGGRKYYPKVIIIDKVDIDNRKVELIYCK